MSTTPLNFLHGDRANLESKAITEGTVYVAKGDDKRAYMYVDLDGQRYDISAPNSTYYGISSDVDEDARTVACDDFELEPGITITVLFTTAPHLGALATLNVNNTGDVPIFYKGSNSLGKTLPANSVYTFIYIDGKFHLIGDLDNKTTISSSTTTTFKPIVINNGTTGQFETGLYNANKPITAQLSSGTIKAPGGIETAGENDSFGNNQSIQYSNQGIIYRDQDDERSYDIYFNPGSIKILDLQNWMKCLSINIAGGEMYFNGNIVANNGLSTYGDLIVDGNVSTEYGNFYSQGYRLPRVYYGTSAPDDGDGEDGDIYIMYS